MPKLLRTLARALSILLGAFVLRTFLNERCRPQMERRPRRPKSRADCQPVSSAIYRRPDPLIYDQYYLMGLGLPVTWDNPDIWLERGGVRVDPHALDPDTVYEVVARVWNASTNAPAVALPVRFSYLRFGIGMETHSIGTTFVDLGVKGSAYCPTFARHAWLTPKTVGHYCVQVLLDWFDDANPLNNLGQTNTDVQPLNSPVARFRVPIRNGGRRVERVRLQADAYALLAPPPCRDDLAASADMSSAERDGRIRDAIARHAKGRGRLPEGWEFRIDTPTFTLEPGRTREITAEATAPDGFEGRIGFNVNALDGVLLGGVTLYADGRSTQAQRAHR